MLSSRNTALQNPNEDGARFLSPSRRQAALQELEEQFHIQLNEEEVFRAASLFFALLAEGAFVNKESIAQEARLQVGVAIGVAPGVEKDTA